MANHTVNELLPTADDASNIFPNAAGKTADRDIVEPVAVVGLSFGFPGEAISSDAFWELLMKKRSTATEFPGSRLNISNMYHPDHNRKGQIPVRGGHFLRDDIATFDAPFFSISSSDAAVMDPQQRKLLEYTYKALENAGMPLEQCKCSKTSVYIGAFTNDWQHLSFKDSEECGTTTALGVQPCLNVNRISWFYDFKGNSANIDTACSSSLVAMHLGCKDLRSGEAEMSIVGGSSLIFSPDYLHSLSMMNMLSVNGQCYSFDHRGTGYGRGEGIGILVLKRLSDALRNGDTIRAVIRNTGCNQDGYTPGITEPNHKSQEALIRETYSTAGLSMLPTRFFEAHGTGTPVGDPTETKALGAAFSKARTLQDPLWIGAVKSNIGHLEGCSGIASVIKTILVLEKGVIPPNTNFEMVNPKIHPEYLKIKFPLEPIKWPCKGVRRASVNSFGYAGTNAHAILDDTLSYLDERKLVGHHITIRDPILSQDLRRSTLASSPLLLPNGNKSEGLLQTPKILMFSAQDEPGLKRQVLEYQSFLERLEMSHNQQKAYLNNLVYTLDHRRTLLAWRSSAIIESTNDLCRLEKIVSPAQRAMSRPALGFVFTGQGAQWTGMGRELIVFSVYENSLQKAELHLSEFGCPWLLREELFKQGEQSNIDDPSYSQPICTALQIALVDLLSDFGIQPTAVVGHSSGEIGAAYCMGAISAKAALKVAYFRGVVSGRLARDKSQQLGMISVWLSQTDVQRYIDNLSLRFGDCGLTVACINSNKNVSISGDLAQINALNVLMDDNNISARKLRVDVAYHSPYMLPLTDAYRSMIGVIERGNASSRPKTMISSVTGTMITAEDLQSPEYWITNMVSPVNFSAAITHLVGQTTQHVRKKLDLSHRHKLSLNVLLEVGPHSALQGPIRDQLTAMPRSSNISYTSILRRKTSALKSTLSAVGELKCLGCPIDLVNICVQRGKNFNDLMVLPNLPEYQFDRSKTFWFESGLNKNFRTQRQGKLDLLGKPVPDWNPLEARWRNHLRVTEMPWIEDHIINGTMIYPGAGMLATAIEAAHQMADRSREILGFELKDVQFMEPLTIPQDPAGLETQLSLHLTAETPGFVSTWSVFRLCAFDNERWHESCRGFIRVQYTAEHGKVEGSREGAQKLDECREIEAQMSKSCQEPVDTKAFYQNLPNVGFDLGPTFKRINSAALGKDHQAIGNVRIFEWPKTENPQAHIIHPTTLDAILQMAVVILTEGGRKAMQTMIPSSIGYLRISKDGLSFPEASSVNVSVWMTAQDNRGTEFDNFVLNENRSRVLAQLSGMRLTIIAGNAASDMNEGQERLDCYHLEYKPDLDLLQAGQRLVCDKNAGFGLNDYLNILAFKHPGLKVLEIGPGTEESSSENLDEISRPPDQHEGLHMGLISYHYSNSSNTENQDVIAEAYDVLIASDSWHQDEDIESSLSPTLKFLKSGGWLFLPMKSEGDTLGSRKNGYGREVLLGKNLCNLSPEFTLEVLEQNESVCVVRKKPMRINHRNEWHKKQVRIVIEPTSDLQARFAERIGADISTMYVGCHFEIHSLSHASSLQIKDDVVFIVLLELDKPLIFALSEAEYPVLRHFLTTAKDIIWITLSEPRLPRKPEFGAIDGLARVMRNECEGMRFTTVVLEHREEITDQHLQKLSQVLDMNHFHIDPNSDQVEPEFVEINSVLNIPRLVPHKGLSQEVHVRSMPQRSSLKPIREAPPLKLRIGSPGLLDTLHFANDEESSKPLTKGEVEIKTEAIGLNFKDCLIALAQTPGSTFGLECAGTVSRVGTGSGFTLGDKVVMFAQGIFKTFARGPSCATCKTPDTLAPVETAAIPAQFITAYTVICRMARLRAGESILIHAAAGGTGQACVQIAQFVGANVLATVGSLEKKRILMEEYGINESNIFDSRTLSFAQGVKRITKGRGADVVINSLPGEGMMASWECIAPSGRFVEIGKKDIIANSKLPMSLFAKNAAFMGFDLATWQMEQAFQMKADLELLMDMFAKGQLHVQRPLNVHSIADILEVFRSLSSGRSGGKFVLEVLPEAQVPTTLDNTAGFGLEPSATYVIAGGLGEIGRSTARWMIGRNARNLILLSRSGNTNEKARTFIEELEHEGVRVEAPACDITNSKMMHETLGNLVRNMPPVNGCVQATMNARDVLFQNMTFDDWQSGVTPKTIGSWNLHNTLPKGMDFFVLLSSASGLVGLRGQANYNTGNTYEDAFARYRVSVCGEKTVSLNLGAMVDDGMLAEDLDWLERVLTYGVLAPITRSKYYGILDYYCDPGLPVWKASQSQMAIGIGIEGRKSGGLDGVNVDQNPLFRKAVYESQVAVSTSQGIGEAEDDDSYIRSSFSHTSSLPEAANVVVKAVIRKLAKTLPALPQSPEEIDINRQIQSYSVDSLIAVELRNWIKKVFKAEVAVFETQGASTFATLGKVVAEKSTLDHTGWSL